MTAPTPESRRTYHETEHKDRHELLHKLLDELVADYLRHNPGSYPDSTTVMQLMEWSYSQTQNPTQEK